MNYKRQRGLKIKEFAKKLNRNEPKSEVWFKSLYFKHFKNKNDFFNKVLYQKYIPDVVNFKYKYIIEIDGSIHELSNVKIKDEQKDEYYKSKGFKVFRLKAYDVKGYIDLIYYLIDIRGRTEFPQKQFSEFKARANYKGPDLSRLTSGANLGVKYQSETVGEVVKPKTILRKRMLKAI